MPMARSDQNAGGGRGFSLIELLVVIAIIALLISIILPAMAQARRSARTTQCATQLQQMGVSTASYGIDHRDLIWNYSWKTPDAMKSTYSDLQTVGNDMDAQRSQYVDVFRRLTTRPLNKETTLLPQILYGHFVLFDYLAARLPEPIYTCPADRVRLTWARDIDAFVAGGSPPYPSAAGTPIPPGDRDIRWAYSSTYEVTVSAYDGSQSEKIRTASNARLRNTAGNHFLFSGTTNWKLSQQPLNAVMYPAQKVFLHEGHARHEKRETYYAVATAKVNILMFDGSSTYKKTGEANRGWDPWTPSNGSGFLYAYVPDAWEPRTASGGANDQVYGYYRYTRGGLRGIDVGGKEINTGQP